MNDEQQAAEVAANAARVKRSREYAEEIIRLDQRIEKQKETLKFLRESREEAIQSLVELDASPVQQVMDFGGGA